MLSFVRALKLHLPVMVPCPSLVVSHRRLVTYLPVRLKTVRYCNKASVKVAPYVLIRDREYCTWPDYCSDAQKRKEILI